MQQISLYVDESGSANPANKNSSFHTLCGCLVEEFDRQRLQIEADQIKFKYWGTTDIVFHSREIARQEGAFAILKDPQIRTAFHDDLFHFLRTGAYRLIVVAVDNASAFRRGWNQRKVYLVTSDMLVRNFILVLLEEKNRKGRLVFESATTERDFIFHKAVGYYLCSGIKQLNISHRAVKDVLTEVSFVTKRNLGIGEQIADLLAYGARLTVDKSEGADNNSYDTLLLEILERKLHTGNVMIKGIQVLPK